MYSQLLDQETLTRWQEKFSAWLQDRSSSQLTISAYLQDVSIYERWFLQINEQPFSPELMNSTDVRSFRQWTLEVERRLPATWNRRRASIGMLCAFIEDYFDIRLFRMDRIPRAIEAAKAPRWLSESDKRRVLRELEIQINAANTDERRSRAIRDQAIISLMLFSGLRISEVLDLQMADLILSERKGKVFIRDGKGGVFGEVPLSTSARNMLEDYLQDRSGASDYLFFGENGAKLGARGVQKRVQQLETRLGIDGLEPHALRHTAAKSMMDAGAQLTEVQRILRHKRITTTARYTQPGEEDLVNAVERGELGKGYRNG